MIRPDAATALQLGKGLLEGVTVKTIVLTTLGLAGWHYANMVAVKDLSADVKALHQQVQDHDARLLLNRDTTMKKVDRDTYDRDVRTIDESLARLQTGQEEILRLLVERPPR